MNITRDLLLTPPDEFSPFPFWFLNGDLRDEEIDRQLTAFHEKGICGAVLHPRIGVDADIEYLGERFLHAIRHAVETASRLGMRVLLYDEAMYPSGSCHGKVVAKDPSYAAMGLRALKMGEKTDADETVLYRFAVKTEGERLISARLLTKNGKPREDETLLRLAYGPTHGTIRGIHEGEDDGQPGAPAAADLMNADAMKTFISLTHDKYYECLSGYFGNTVIGFFTDEPSPVGRCARRGAVAWSGGFEKDISAQGLSADDLPHLFIGGERTDEVKQKYERALCERLKRTYYGPISDWCESHMIHLCGHPHSPMDSSLLTCFGIPGQDVVWRWVAPEKGLSVGGRESAQAKCASDTARALGRRRNLNECFGCCGKNGVQWSLTVSDMKWYMDWLFVRGCNFLIPHAFYYSIDTPVKLDRPPDVGMNSIWWEDWGQLSRYIKVLSALNTDCVNGAKIAVLGTCDTLPVDAVKYLYRHQIEFNYVTDECLAERAKYEHGSVFLGGNRYDLVLLDPALVYRRDALDRLTQNGVKTVQKAGAKLLPYAAVKASPACGQLRVTLTRHENAEALLIVNEGGKPWEGTLSLPFDGDIAVFDPWNNTLTRARGNSLSLRMEGRQSLVLLSGMETEGLPVFTRPAWKKEKPLDDEWTLTLPSGKKVKGLGDWSRISETKRFCGELSYTCKVTYSGRGRLMLRLGDVREKAKVYVNGVYAGTLLTAPFDIEISGLCRKGQNTVEVRVTNAPVPLYDGRPFPSGMRGGSGICGEKL